MSLSLEQYKVASMIRWRAESVKAEDIRPLSEKDGSVVRTSRAAGLAIWQEREAFVAFFSADSSFDADLFRVSATPDAPSCSLAKPSLRVS